MGNFSPYVGLKLTCEYIFVTPPDFMLFWHNMFLSRPLSPEISGDDGSPNNFFIFFLVGRSFLIDIDRFIVSLVLLADVLGLGGKTGSKNGGEIVLTVSFFSKYFRINLISGVFSWFPFDILS